MKSEKEERHEALEMVRHLQRVRENLFNEERGKE